LKCWRRASLPWDAPWSRLIECFAASLAHSKDYRPNSELRMRGSSNQGFLIAQLCRLSCEQLSSWHMVL
jgi:hypothetical protein